MGREERKERGISQPYIGQWKCTAREGASLEAEGRRKLVFCIVA